MRLTTILGVPMPVAYSRAWHTVMACAGMCWHRRRAGRGMSLFLVLWGVAATVALLTLRIRRIGQKEI